MSQDSIVNLINYTVSEDHERPDLEACLEITDRVNSSKPECLETILTIVKNMGKPNYKCALNCLQLLETLSKNCNMRFLYELNNKKLMDAMMKILESRRTSARTKKPIKSKDPYKTEVEDKALYLIQLWADTFMMHQTEFKNIHEAYRNLRKDAVKFPDRDPNEKFMISFQGQVSPIFLAMSENYIVPSNNQGGAPPDPRRMEPKPVYREPEYEHETANYKESKVNTLYNEEVDYDYSVYDGIEITSDEIKVLDESINILKDIENNAVVPGDMKSEIANEILADMVHVQKRVKRMLNMDRFNSSSQRSECTKINDKINSTLRAYRSRYSVLKENYARGIRSEPVHAPAPKYQEHEHEEGLFDDNIRKKMQSHAGGKSDNQAISGGDKNKIEKPEHIGARKLAPPKGWKEGPPQADAAKKEAIDLLDLLDAEPVKADNKEEKKENTPENKGNSTPSLLSAGLMDFNFNPTSNTQPQGNMGGFGYPQQQQLGGFNQPQFNQFNTAFNYPQAGGMNFMNPQFMSVGGGAPVQGHFSPQGVNVQGGFSPQVPNNVNNFANAMSPGGMNQAPLNDVTQGQSNGATPINVTETKPVQNNNEDDDDFFGSIANRNK